MKVFILEDSKDRFEFLKKFHKKDIIYWSKTVPDAIKTFKKFEPFDLILLDHDLGDELDPCIGNGVEFAKFLAEQRTDSQIIIHSINVDGAKRMKDYLPDATLIPIYMW